MEFNRIDKKSSEEYNQEIKGSDLDGRSGR